MSKVYNPALQERLESYLANSGISQAKLAPKVGISQTALSQYRRSKYDNGDIAELERKLEEFFRTEEAVEAAAVKAAPYVDIEVLNENFRKIDASASSLEVTLRIEADETTVVAVSHSSGTYSGISTFSCAISSGSVSPSFTWSCEKNVGLKSIPTWCFFAKSTHFLKCFGSNLSRSANSPFSKIA